MTSSVKRGIRLGAGLAGIAVGAVLVAHPASAASVSSWEFGAADGSQLFTLGANSSLGYAGYTGRISDTVALVGQHSTLRIEYLGKEAIYDSTASVSPQGAAPVVVADTETSSVGQLLEVALPGSGDITFTFAVNGGGGVGTVSGASANIWYATAATDDRLGFNDLIIGFEDLKIGDQDYDDLMVKVTASPVPAAGLLFGTALAGLGGLVARRRKSLSRSA